METKKNINYGKKLIFVIAFLFLFLISTNFVASTNIGISPAKISFDGVLRGGYAERTVTISVDSDKETTISISPRGEISDWMNFSDKTFKVSKGNPYLLKISVNPHEDTPNGNYSGFLRVEISGTGEAEEGKATGIVKTALDLYINVEITDVQYLDCKASNFKVESAEEGDPIIFSMDVLNRGNVKLKPDIRVDVWDKNQIEIVHSEEIKGDEIIPTTEKEISFNLDSNEFDIGQYWVEVSAVSCDVSETLTFDVLKEGALKSQGTLSKIVTPPWVESGETTSIEAFFDNTGEKTVNAQFRGEITSGSKIVQILQSENIDIPIDSEDSFKFYFTPKVPGKYIVSGRVFYDGKRTYEKSAVINVKKSQLTAKKVLTASSYVVLLFFISFIIYKIRKERKAYSKKFGRLGK